MKKFIKEIEIIFDDNENINDLSFWVGYDCLNEEDLFFNSVRCQSYRFQDGGGYVLSYAQLRNILKRWNENSPESIKTIYKYFSRCRKLGVFNPSEDIRVKISRSKGSLTAKIVEVSTHLCD